MSGFKHSWNGTILTITSDSGTSSADLKGSVGDIGPRGPQGPAGISIGADGNIDINSLLRTIFSFDEATGRLDITV